MAMVIGREPGVRDKGKITSRPFQDRMAGAKLHAMSVRPDAIQTSDSPGRCLQHRPGLGSQPLEQKEHDLCTT